MLRQIFLTSVVFSPILANCEGVVAAKEQAFHSNDVAKIIKFDQVRPDGFVTWFFVGGKRVRFESTQWFRYIEFPPALIEATDPKILPSRLKLLGELQEFSNQFKGATPLMKEAIAKVRNETEHLKGGMVLFRGNWTPRTDYELSLKREAEEFERQRQEVIRQEEHARELEVQRLNSEAQRLKREADLEIAKSNERRAKKIQAIRDEISQITKEKDTLKQQNITLEQELLKITQQVEVNPQ